MAIKNTMNDVITGITHEFYITINPIEIIHRFNEAGNKIFSLLYGVKYYTTDKKEQVIDKQERYFVDVDINNVGNPYDVCYNHLKMHDRFKDSIDV